MSESNQEVDPESSESESGSGSGTDSGSSKGVDLVSQGDIAADYLEGLLDIADLDGDIDIDVENDRAYLEIVEVSDGELDNLVGEDGEVLNALQDLTRLP